MYGGTGPACSDEYGIPVEKVAATSGRLLYDHRVAEIKCAHCAGSDLEPGFMGGVDGSDYSSWFPGPLEFGAVFGGVKNRGRRRLEVESWRCRNCGHLELFANRPV